MVYYIITPANDWSKEHSKHVTGYSRLLGRPPAVTSNFVKQGGGATAAMAATEGDLTMSNTDPSMTFSTTLDSSNSAKLDITRFGQTLSPPPRSPPLTLTYLCASCTYHLQLHTYTHEVINQRRVPTALRLHCLSQVKDSISLNVRERRGKKRKEGKKVGGRRGEEGREGRGGEGR